jgi:hypothetical protein
MSLDVGREYGGGAVILFCCRQSMFKLDDIAVSIAVYIPYFSNDDSSISYPTKIA